MDNGDGTRGAAVTLLQPPCVLWILGRQVLLRSRLRPRQPVPMAASCLSFRSRCCDERPPGVKSKVTALRRSTSRTSQEGRPARHTGSHSVASKCKFEGSRTRNATPPSGSMLVVERTHAATQFLFSPHKQVNGEEWQRKIRQWFATRRVNCAVQPNPHALGSLRTPNS